jgi:hypothetical protein
MRALAADEHHRDARPAIDDRRIDIRPGHVREADVEHERVRLLFLHRRDDVGGAIDDARADALHVEQDARAVRELLVVVGDEN